MIQHLLVPLLIAEAGFLLLGVLALVGCAARASVRHHRDAARTRHARMLVLAAVLKDSAFTPAVAALRDLPTGSRRAVLLQLVGSISGAELTRLRDLALASGVITRAEQWSRSRRWWRRLRGLRLLAQLGTDDAAHRFLDDPHAAVRAAAADAVATPVAPEVLDRLLAMLDDQDAACRFSAKSTLLRAGRSAAAGVRSYLDAELVRQPDSALAVAAALADPTFLGPALRLSEAPEPAVRRGASTLLARIGGEQVARRLEQLLDDTDADVRATAAQGLGELGHWPAAAALAVGLQDPTWDVRAAAAVALRRMGPPGRIYLRRATHADDMFAADIARQVLALPDGSMSLVDR